MAAHGLPPEVRNLIAAYAFVPNGPLLEPAEVAAFRAETVGERGEGGGGREPALLKYFYGVRGLGEFVRRGRVHVARGRAYCGYLRRSFEG